jgi:hypothetical protein
MTPTEQLADLDLVIDGKKVASPSFAVDLYTDKPFTTIAEQVLACYDMFLRLCPPDRLRYYATETMDRHKETSARTFTMLPTWLKKGAPARKYVFLELMSGEDREAVPDFRLFVGGFEPGSIGYSDRAANQIRLCVPAAWGADHPSEMRDMVIHLASLVPFTAGHAGYSMEWSRYFKMKACPHAYRVGMRHPGFDIPGGANDRLMVGHDGLKTVGWLTLVGEPLLTSLGGTGRLEQQASVQVRTRPSGTGMMIEAGDLPEVGDVNRGDRLPALAEAFRLVAPVAQTAFQRSKAMTFLPGDMYENTQRWLRRFEAQQ